ncbi:MAG: hypothetical protein DRJ52_07315 [Thermoprotei archaeon]|nr:MAG: hypothetical protein DRJ52_07315 [Thermoprotei archaeon]RLF00585.1 MAG: hypothetical protein DRJ63_02065 [Thermoprotei archaeon]HDI74338.1 hypothetical protein [Thermoprotei archaeon]
MIEKLDVLKARRAVFSGRVWKIIVESQGNSWETWIVYGPKMKTCHIVVPGKHCDCLDFLFNVIIRRKKCACYHIIAQKMAEAQGKYQTVVLKEEDFVEVLITQKLKGNITIWSMPRQRLQP